MGILKKKLPAKNRQSVSFEREALFQDGDPVSFSVKKTDDVDGVIFFGDHIERNVVLNKRESDPPCF